MRASRPLPPPRVQPGSPGPRLTGVIELHEAKGRHEVLQAAPLARPKASGVQEEGEVGQKEVPEPEGFGGSHLHGVRAFLRAGGRVKQGEAGGPARGWAGGRADDRPRSLGLCHPVPPIPGPRRSRGLPEKGPFLALEANAFAAVGGTEQPPMRVCRCECDRTHSALLRVWAQAASGGVGEGSCGETSAGGQGSPRPQG